MGNSHNSFKYLRSTSRKHLSELLSVYLFISNTLRSIHLNPIVTRNLEIVYKLFVSKYIICFESCLGRKASSIYCWIWNLIRANLTDIYSFCKGYGSERKGTLRNNQLSIRPCDRGIETKFSHWLPILEQITKNFWEIKNLRVQERLI